MVSRPLAALALAAVLGSSPATCELRSRRTYHDPCTLFDTGCSCELADSSRISVALASLCRSRRSLAVRVRAVAVPCVWRRPRLPP
eukprot:4146451-Prymnesium_polylepis.1